MNFMKRFSPLFWYTVTGGVGLSLVAGLCLNGVLKQMLLQAALGASTKDQDYLLHGRVAIHNLTNFVVAMQPQVLHVPPVSWLLAVIVTLYTFVCTASFGASYLIGDRLLQKKLDESPR